MLDAPPLVVVEHVVIVEPVAPAPSPYTAAIALVAQALAAAAAANLAAMRAADASKRAETAGSLQKVRLSSFRTTRIYLLIYIDLSGYLSIYLQ